MLARLSIRVKFQKSDLFEVGVIPRANPNPTRKPQSHAQTPIPRANPNPTRKPQSVAPAPNGYFISLELPNH